MRSPRRLHDSPQRRGETQDVPLRAGDDGEVTFSLHAANLAGSVGAAPGACLPPRARLLIPRDFPLPGLCSCAQTRLAVRVPSTARKRPLPGAQ